VVAFNPFNIIIPKIQGIVKNQADTDDSQDDEIGELLHKYSSILDSLPVFITVMNTEMKWTFINKAGEKVLGKKREDLYGLPCNHLCLSICNTEDCTIARAKRGLMQTHFEYKDSSFQTDITILKDLHGKTTGFLQVIQDVTKLKMMAKQQAEAEDASRAKSNFLSTMSHEIRTPLNAIIGMTTIGKYSVNTEQKDQALDKIDTASKYLLHIINDILDMSKIEAGKFELAPVESSFEKTLEQIRDIFIFRIESKQQKFTINIDPDIPKILIFDDHRLTQVITNLLGNAVKFTQAGGSITLNVCSLGEENGSFSVKISVTDTGIGISPDQQARLFNSFTQAESDMARNFGGTGLGLAISKSIIEMMGGTIWIESEAGKGSSFVFTIKAKPVIGSESQAAFQNPQDTSAENSEPVEDVKLTGRRILLAEDIEINREIVLALLEPTEVQIDCATNGAEAVRMFSETPEKYDLILMDLHMPEMDGYQATHFIRGSGLHSSKTIPIIAMTANVFREDVQKCLNAGMTDHIGKPLDFNKLIEKLNIHLAAG
jgi:PAS domain S-box-containing protein